jgi:hypothetical protein
MTRTQIGVAVGMGAALAATIALFLAGMGGVVRSPFDDRIRLAIAAALGPLGCVAVAIGFIANRRFFSAEDIEGSGLSEGTSAVRIARSVLENTIEQAALAVPLYVALAMSLPARAVALPLLLSVAFVIGRALFAAGYARGAAARSFGFALTFYPSVGALAVLAGWAFS